MTAPRDPGSATRARMGRGQRDGAWARDHAPLAEPEPA